MSNIIDSLNSLGLSNQESQVYLALLKIGGSTASIIAKEIGVKRTTVYPVLKELVEKGYVLVYFKKSKRIYYAEKPYKIAGIFEKKLEFFNNAIPLLDSMEKSQIKIFGLRFVETKEKLKRFYLDILSEYKNKSYRVIGNTVYWEKVDPEFFMQYRKDRARLNIKTKLILSADSKDFNPTDKSLLREYKYFPEKYKFRSTMNIFDDKILIISPDLASLAIVIAIPAMVDIFKSMFEIIWDNIA